MDSNSDPVDRALQVYAMMAAREVIDRMSCPYHPNREAAIPVPAQLEGDTGWIGWLVGCCGLPAWRCAEGELLPMEAHFCTFHGCARPRMNRVAHEWTPGAGQPRTIPPPPPIHRTLEIAPNGDGASTPCLAGNVLVYLTENGRLVALDAGGDATVFLAAQIQAAAMQVEGGRVVGALKTEAGVRYLAWEVRELREALKRGGVVKPEPATGAISHLLGLPRDHSRLHQGSGLMRLVVEHDPVADEDLIATYRKVTGANPGKWVIRRTPNPDGPPIHHPHLRPQRLFQIPVPLPGGILVLGQVRHLGTTASGALLIPNAGRVDAAA